jgi:hypothetical protein
MSHPTIPLAEASHADALDLDGRRPAGPAHPSTRNTGRASGSSGKSLAVARSRSTRGGRPSRGTASTRHDTDVTAHIAPQLRALVVPLDSVTLHPRNPRQGDVAAVAASLRRFGQLKTVVVQASTRYVVAGNHLVRAARSLGWTEIAANVEELDDAEATAFMLADNRTSDLGGYDDALLAAILAEQEAADNLAATGYDDDDVAALLRAAGIEASHGDPDAAPDRPADADVYVRPGELWALGRHRLLVDDSTDPAAVERVTAGTSVDMVWCDPPYSVGVVGRTAAALTIVNDNLDAAGTRALIGTALGLAPLRPGGAFYVAAPAGPAHLVFLLALADASLPRPPDAHLGEGPVRPRTLGLPLPS